MNSYLFIYEKGNGYHCQCCRQTWLTTDVNEFNTDQEAMDFVEKFKRENTGKDYKILTVYPLRDENPIFENGYSYLTSPNN